MPGLTIEHFAMLFLAWFIAVIVMFILGYFRNDRNSDH